MQRVVSTATRLEPVLQWLRESETTATPIPATWVPGAEPAERARLAALGGLVKALVGADAAGVFAAPELTAWLDDGPIPSEEVILAGKTLLAESPDEGLAGLYSQVVSGKSRRTLGTFFTPPDEVSWMVNRWSEQHPTPDSVIDVGAGVGIFTTVAAQHWPNARIWAIDINPITLGLLALRVHASFPLRTDDADDAGLRLTLDDFTLWMADRWPSTPGRRLVLGNPPYTRLQLLPPDQRDRLWEAASGLCGRRASLSALITAMSLSALNPGDGLCLLLPAQWLESDYARALRQHLWGLRERRVELHLFDDKLFKDAQVDAVALIVGPDTASAQPIVFSGGPLEVTISDRANCPSKWRPLFDGSSGTATAAAGAVLSDLLAVRRGVATGANEFFVVNESRRVELDLDPAVLTPLVRRLLRLPDVVDATALAAQLDNERYWLLTTTPDLVRTDDALRTYIASGEDESNGFDLRHLCQIRPHWYDLTDEVRLPDLVIGQSTKKDFRFVEIASETGATILNNLYGMKWREGVPPETRADLLSWLRSDDGQAALTAQARTQGLRLVKIEPRALMNVRLPARFTPMTGTLV